MFMNTFARITYYLQIMLFNGFVQTSIVKSKTIQTKTARIR